jgi:hypothetical protein
MKNKHKHPIIHKNTNMYKQYSTFKAIGKLVKELKLSYDTTVLKPDNFTIFTIFNYTLSDSKLVWNKFRDLNNLNITFQGKNHIISEINNSTDICHPEFIHTYHSVSSSNNVFVEKNYDSLNKIKSHMKNLTRNNLFGNKKDIIEQAKSDLMSRKKSLVIKLVKLDLQKFDLIPEDIDNITIKKIDLLTGLNYGYIVMSDELFDMDCFFSDNDAITREKITMFNNVF